MTDEHELTEQETHTSEGARIDTTMPNVARIWNYWLGGRDNFETDRRTARQLEEVAPRIALVAPASRAFLRRTVQYLAEEAGIRQFIDLAAGLPAIDNTSEIAQAVAPECRVLYVDNDPIVLVHARALLTSSPEGVVSYLEADISDYGRIIGEAQRIFDFSKPVAIVKINVPNFSGDTASVRNILAAMPHGSYIAIAELVDDLDPALLAVEQRWHQMTGVPVALPSLKDLMGFFDGLDLVEPGVVMVPEWRRAENEPANIDLVPLYGAIAKKPEAIQHRWFVTAPEGTDLRSLLTGIEERGIKPYVLSDVASFGTSLVRSLKGAIADADRVVVVLTAAGQSLNSAFEAGMAAALGKPVIVIAPPAIKLPSNFAGFLTVRAHPDDLDAINFALDQAEGRIPPPYPSAPISGDALGVRVDELLDRADRILSLKGPAAIEQAAIDLLSEAIEGSGAVAVQANATDGRFDLGVWSDDLDSIAANPLLIQVRRTFGHTSARQAIAALQNNSHAHAVLIVVLDHSRSGPGALGTARFPTLAVSLKDLLGRMRTASFAEVVRQLRNQSVHGVSAR